MMIGELDVGVIALGIFVAMFAPLVLMIAVMSADAPGSSHAPGYMIIGGGVALVALIAWWVDHPFQFLGGIALAVGGFGGYVALSNFNEYLARRREETAAPEPPRRSLPCALMWAGIEVARFEAGEGLPPETDPDLSYRVPTTHGSADAGTLTFRSGSSRDADFVQWCASGGTRGAPQSNASGAAVAMPREIGVQIFNDGKKVAEITLKAARPSQFEVAAAAAPAGDATEIALLTLEYQAWKHAWESLDWPTKKA